jgi:Oxidoreductase molybdopterin binding domain
VKYIASDRPVTNENVTYFAAGAVVTQSFTGTLLWDLLQSVGIVVDPKIKNDILRKVVIVKGSDGYQSVFGAGEIAPTFGGAQIMVAYAADGQALGKDGFARIVAPGDKAGGRFVSNIVKIEVQDAGK